MILIKTQFTLYFIKNTTLENSKIQKKQIKSEYTRQSDL